MDKKLEEQIAAIVGLDQGTAAFRTLGHGAGAFYQGVKDEGVLPGEAFLLTVNFFERLVKGMREGQ